MTESSAQGLHVRTDKYEIGNYITYKLDSHLSIAGLMDNVVLIASETILYLVLVKITYFHSAIYS